MSGPRITDNALLRFLERAGGLDVEAVRSSMAAGLARSHAAARSMGNADHLIVVDRLAYVVRSGTVTTVIPARTAGGRLAILKDARDA